jgi:glycine/D-amino acid oxidase-like deaminating enzyme
VAIRGRGTLELTPQGVRYARTFFPLFLARRAGGVSYRIGRSFIEGPEAVSRWKLDQVSPFERTRILDPAPDRGVVTQGMAALKRAYKEFATVEPARAWAGWIDHMPDAIPTISPVEQLPGFFLATGFSGHGFGIGPAAGLLAADLMAGDPPLVDPAPFRYRRLFDGTMGPVGPV